MLEKEMAQIVGNENVIDSASVLEDYSKDISFTPKVKPRCLVKPKDVDHVQSLIRLANEKLAPLIPVSSGTPHFRGDTVPSTGGAIIVDMTRMDKILRVDRRNRVVMVEPGVTFKELIPRLEQEGMRLNLSLLPKSSKSVIGSLLEREPVIMPIYQWDAIDPLSCIEVIFGTGDIFRSGTSAGPGTLDDQWRGKQAQVVPMGPGQTDFARIVQGSQGTMGIVTWATIRCEQSPTVQKPFLVGTEEFEKISDFIYRMLWLKFGDEYIVLNNSCLAAIMAKGHDEYNIIRNNLPHWILFLCLSGYEYFPEERVEYQEKEMFKVASEYGLEPKNSISEVSAYEILKLVGKTSEEPYWKIRRKGACQEIFFLTTIDQVSRFVKSMHELSEQYDFSSSDMGIYIQPMIQGTSCHCEFIMFYDPNSSKELIKVKELYTRAGETLMNIGAFFSRPYGSLANIVLNRDGESTSALKKVKTIFDPNNIMNTGKLCF